jgi:hypothetical protein
VSAEPGPAGGIVYQPYISVFSWLSDVRPLRTGQGQFHDDVTSSFSTFCETYRRGVEERQRLQAGANGLARIAKDERMDEWVLRPACLDSLGASDALTVVLMDDFDPMLRMASEIDLPIDRMMLGFCPTISSLGLSRFVLATATGAKPRCPFVEVHELVEDLRKAEPGSDSNPFLVLSLFKVGGLGALGRSLVRESTIFEAMAKRIIQVSESLVEQIESPGLNNLEITRLDLDTYECAVVEGQGAESVLLLIACRNLSIAYSFIAALRGLTYGDLESLDRARLSSPRPDFDDERLPRAFVRVHDQGQARESGSTRDSSVVESLGLSSNHVFAASMSTVALLAMAFRDPTRFDIRGWVDAQARVGCCPGHEIDGGRLLAGSLRRRRSVEVDEPPKILVGALDLSSPIEDRTASRENGVPTRGLLESLFGLLESFRAEGEECGESGLLQSSTVLSVPFPDFVLRAVEKKRHYPVLKVLEKLGRTPLQPRGGTSTRSLPKWQTLLHDGTRRWQLPLTLCRSIELVFKKYARALENPHLFDVVIDLQDAIAALYEALTPAQPEHAIPRTETSIRELSHVVQALQNALGQRMTTRPNSEASDWAVDFRGSLQRLVLALDAPLKSGIGLLRWCYRSLDVFHEGAIPSVRSSDRMWGEPPDGPRVCAVTRFGLEPRPVCRQLLIGSPGVFARVDMNVGQLFHPSHMILLFHEAFHFIYGMHPELQALRDLWNRSYAVASTEHTRKIRTAADEHREEVFAEILTLLFVFGGNWRLYRVFTLSKFFYDPISLADSLDGRKLRLLETLFRVFLVSAPARQLVQDFHRFDEHDELRLDDICDPMEWPDTHPWRSEHPTGRTLSERFVRFCRKYSHLVPEDWGLFGSSPDAALMLRFEALYEMTQEEEFVLWERALEIYKHFARQTPWGLSSQRGAPDSLSPGGSNSPGNETSSRPRSRASIRRVFRESFDLARDSSDEIYEKLRLEQQSLDRAAVPGGVENPAMYPRLLELVAICETFYDYAWFCFDEIRSELDRVANGNSSPKRFHVRRDRDGNVRVDSRPSVKLLLDRRYGGQYCYDPETRRRRIVRKVLVFKMLQNMSVRQRARRLSQLLEGVVRFGVET